MAERAAPFETGWWGIELPEARECDGTYCFFSEDSLPPLDESLFRGEFQWLTHSAAADGENDDLPGRATTLTLLKEKAAQANLILPQEFIRFMSDFDLQAAVPSCTACEFDLGALVPSIVEEGAYTLLFLRDQQDVLLWYLYLTPDGSCSVICSPIPFDDPEIDEPAPVVKAHTLIVASSFEAFLYRFWMENTIWFALEEGDGELTSDQQAYMDHYV